MKIKIKEWFKRYFPAEIAATTGAVLFGGGTFLLTSNSILSAFAGVIGDNIGFYGYIFLMDALKIHKRNNHSKLKTSISTVKNLFIEFGFSEVLDSLIIRPFCLYIFPILLNNYTLGIIIGKIVADFIFYIPTVIAYELTKKHLKKKRIL